MLSIFHNVSKAIDLDSVGFKLAWVGSGPFCSGLFLFAIELCRVWMALRRQQRQQNLGKAALGQEWLQREFFGVSRCLNENLQTTSDFTLLSGQLTCWWFHTTHQLTQKRHPNRLLPRGLAGPYPHSTPLNFHPQPYKYHFLIKGLNPSSRPFQSCLPWPTLPLHIVDRKTKTTDGQKVQLKLGDQASWRCKAWSGFDLKTTQKYLFGSS